MKREITFNTEWEDLTLVLETDLTEAPSGELDIYVQWEHFEKFIVGEDFAERSYWIDDELLQEHLEISADRGELRRVADGVYIWFL